MVNILIKWLTVKGFQDCTQSLKCSLRYQLLVYQVWYFYHKVHDYFTYPLDYMGRLLPDSNFFLFSCSQKTFDGIRRDVTALFWPIFPSQTQNQGSLPGTSDPDKQIEIGSMLSWDIAGRRLYCALGLTSENRHRKQNRGRTEQISIGSITVTCV